MKTRVGQYAFTFLLMFAVGLGLPTSPLLASRMGATWIEIGLMGAAWGLVFTFSAFLTGRISDRVGRRPVLAASAALSALAALLFLRALSVSELIIIRGLEGLAWACFWPPMEALATETVDTEQVGRGIGLITTVYGIAFAIGSFSGGSLADVFGFPLAFGTYLGTASLATVTAWFVESPKHEQPKQPLARGRFLPRLFSRTIAAGNLLGASYTFGLASVMALLSVYAVGLGIPVFWIGVAFSTFWAGRVIGAASAGSASDRFGRRRVAVVGLILGCIGFALVGVANEIIALAGGVLLAGVSVGASFPVSVAIIADNIQADLRGSAMGFFEMICAIAFMTASALGGAAAQVLSPRSPYGASAIVYVSCAVALCVLLPARQGGKMKQPPVLK